MTKEGSGGKRRAASLLLVALLAGCVTVAPGADPTATSGAPLTPTGAPETPKATPDPSAGAVVASPAITPPPGATKKPRRTRRPQTDPPATSAPTIPPTTAPTEPPTTAPTDAPTMGPTPLPDFAPFTFRIPPIDISSLPVLQPIDVTLDYNLPPNYGTATLTSGFVPDPYSVAMTAGGSVNVGYLGGGCTGFATRPPDFEVSYTSGAATLLRLYFVGSGDTTLVVNGPSASYYCVDDSFGTLNPTIDFNSPASGAYDIWVGSYANGTFVSGTLYVTELSGNHP